MVSTARDARLPTHWFNILHDRPQYVASALSRSQLAGLAGERKPIRLVAVESNACPKLTRGRYLYDMSDALGTTPITKVYSLGSTYVPPPEPAVTT